MDRHPQLKNLTDQVAYILETFPVTRENDRLLTVTIRRIFFGIRQSVPVEQYLSGELPTKDNVKRLRAGFNKNNLYLPRDPEVCKRRKINQERYREAFGEDFDVYANRQASKKKRLRDFALH
jgi:hypothetical protein